MRTKKSLRLLGGMILVLLLAVIPHMTAYAQSKPIKFKAVTFLPKGNPTVANFKKMAEGFNERFKGRVLIDWRGGPEVIPAFQLHESVRSGMIDMVATSSSYYVSVLPVSHVIMFSNKNHKEIRESGFFDTFTELHKKVGLIYLGEIAYGLPFHIFVNEPIKRPKDLAGKKIRVFPAISPIVTALGAVPVMMPMPEIYTAMERGVVDGFAMTTTGFVKAFAWHEVTKYMINPPFYRGSVSLLVNPKRWNQLPASLQDEIIKWKYDEFDPAQGKVYAKFGDAQTKLVTKSGVKVIEFSPEDAKAYSKLAYDAAWEKALKKAPEIAPKLQKMLVE